MLHILKETLDAVIAHAGAEAPCEACGYLAAKHGIVVRHYPLTNVDASPEHFSLRPEEQFAAVREMRAAGLHLKAVYHSHPTSAAEPSEEDIQLAGDPDISYVIVSLEGGPGRVRSFKIRGGRAEREEMRIMRQEGPGAYSQREGRKS